MTQLELFAYVLLPLGIAAAGGLITYLYVRADKRRNRHHPAE
jgi:hypothetical protein